MSEEEKEENDSIKFYNCPQEKCSCTDQNGDYTLIARRFRYFYDQVRKEEFGGKGRKATEVLNEMGVVRICCRVKFLNLPLIPMIDRSKNRFYDDIHKTVISEDTRELGFGKDPPDFPIL